MTKKKPTKAELRVEVAKDVLKHLKTLRVLAGNTYVWWGHSNVDYDKSSQTIARDLQKNGCEVCALGACFLSLVALKNKFDFFDCSGVFARSEVTDRLRSAFSDTQMDLIEQAFEWEVGEPPYTDEEKRLNTFASKYPYSRTRLRAIMKNIIKNNGTFKP